MLRKTFLVLTIFLIVHSETFSQQSIGLLYGFSQNKLIDYSKENKELKYNWSSGNYVAFTYQFQIDSILFNCELSYHDYNTNITVDEAHGNYIYYRDLTFNLQQIGLSVLKTERLFSGTNGILEMNFGITGSYIFKIKGEGLAGDSKYAYFLDSNQNPHNYIVHEYYAIDPNQTDVVSSLNMGLLADVEYSWFITNKYSLKFGPRFHYSISPFFKKDYNYTNCFSALFVCGVSRKLF